MADNVQSYDANPLHNPVRYVRAWELNENVTDAVRLREVHRLMDEAAARYGRGETEVAAGLCRHVLELVPGMPHALHLLGLCLWKGGDPVLARGHLEQAARSLSHDALLFQNLGILQVELGDTEAARRAFARAVELNPDLTEARFNLAVTSEELGDPETAELAYRQVLSVEPGHPGAAAALAALCEQKNDLVQAEQWAAQALQTQPQDPVANLVQAQLDFRAGRLEESAARLQGQWTRSQTPRNRALAAGRLGAVYDRLDRSDEAWAMFLEAKAALRATGDSGIAREAYGFETAARIRQYLDRLPVEEPDATAGTGHAGASPVFLVGFPRSGTTLLDQILSSHPGIEVLEEKDTLRDTVDGFALTDEGMDAFRARSLAELRPYREAYWKRVEACFPSRDIAKRFVDKMPLNTLFLPLIRRLFPESRFLFAVRDPRDVVLSCFMQTFFLNQAMRHFLDLEESARYYAAVMEVGTRMLPALGQRVHLIRYESLIGDAAGETRGLFDFLGLDWDPAVLEFDKKARKRRISTPSYHQVAQPLYGQSRGRWRRYAGQLQPIMEILQPYVEYFGYP